MSELDNNTQGTNPILAQLPILQIGDKQYKFRRLGVTDLTFVSRIIDNLVQSGSKKLLMNLIAVDLKDPNTWGAMLLTGLPAIQEPLVEWIANVLKVSPIEIIDPDFFPLDSFLDFFLLLNKHPDFESFLSKVKLLGRSRFMDHLKQDNLSDDEPQPEITSENS